MTQVLLTVWLALKKYRTFLQAGTVRVLCNLKAYKKENKQAIQNAGRISQNVCTGRTRYAIKYINTKRFPSILI